MSLDFEIHIVVIGLELVGHLRQSLLSCIRKFRVSRVEGDPIVG
jgi:hypothetical protein